MGGSAVAFVASRYLPPGVGGRALVDGLRAANEEMVSQVKQNRTDEEMHAAYVRFVEKWCDTPIDATLVGDVAYLSLNCRLNGDCQQKEYLTAGRNAVSTRA